MIRLSSLPWLAGVFVLMFSVGCNDAAKCTNACQNYETCELISNAEACANACRTALEALGEGECHDANSGLVGCEQFASCQSLADDSACSSEKERVEKACSPAEE